MLYLFQIRKKKRTLKIVFFRTPERFSKAMSFVFHAYKNILCMLKFHFQCFGHMKIKF
ncbi:hypothetical protein Hdeb2414_s0015g00442311 [Helianthus debilis subsp. tardiflorus]